jgi:hypothetical protein
MPTVLEWLRSLNALRVLAQVSAPNKSLDASGTTGLVIDNLSVTWLLPAASTQSFGCFLLS